jgi:hypothetical protein
VCLSALTLEAEDIVKQTSVDDDATGLGRGARKWLKRSSGLLQT